MRALLLAIVGLQCCSVALANHCTSPGRVADADVDYGQGGKRDEYAVGSTVKFTCPKEFQLMDDGRPSKAKHLTLTCLPSGMWDKRKPRCRVTYNPILDDQFGNTKPMGLADDTWWATKMKSYGVHLGKPREEGGYHVKKRTYKKKRNEDKKTMFDDHMTAEARANEKKNKLDYDAEA